MPLVLSLFVYYVYTEYTSLGLGWLLQLNFLVSMVVRKFKLLYFSDPRSAWEIVTFITLYD